VGTMAQLATRLEEEITACLDAGPPHGMSKRVFERVQRAAKIQLQAFDEHPDVFRDKMEKELKERMERTVSENQLDQPHCSLCGKQPPFCPHMPLITKKGAHKLSHWVGNQVELQHSASRLAFTAVRPAFKNGRVIAQVVGFDVASQSRLRVKVLGGVVVAHSVEDPAADPVLLRERERLRAILHGIDPLVPVDPVGTRDPELLAATKELGVLGMNEPQQKRVVPRARHHTLKGTDKELSHRAEVVRPPARRKGSPSRSNPLKLDWEKSRWLEGVSSAPPRRSQLGGGQPGGSPSRRGAASRSGSPGASRSRSPGCRTAPARGGAAARKVPPGRGKGISRSSSGSGSQKLGAAAPAAAAAAAPAAAPAAAAPAAPAAAPAAAAAPAPAPVRYS
jgi:hypothetical protein